MPSLCSYFQCKNVLGQKPMFRFPTGDASRLQVWMENCGKVAITHMPEGALRNKFICIDHFENHFISNDCGKRKRLTKFAVPRHYKRDESIRESPESPVLPVASTSQGNMTVTHLPDCALRNKYTCIYHFKKDLISNDCGKRKRLSKLAVPRHYKRDESIRESLESPDSPVASTTQGYDSTKLRVLRPMRTYAPKSAKRDKDQNIEEEEMMQTELLSTPLREINAPLEDSRDPLRIVIEQCRFCGEFSKECIPAISQAYMTDNKTILAFNDVTVHLDFNDASLPTTVCRDCDARLQEMFDFMKVVKTAQSTLINVAEKREEIEPLVIKTECDEDDESQDHEGNNDDDENTDGIVDSVTVGETVYIKERFAHKRKTVHDKTETAKSKKPKIKEKEIGACEIMNEIKEEVIEDDTHAVNSANSYTGYLTQLGLGSETGCERQFQSGLCDTGTDYLW